MALNKQSGNMYNFVTHTFNIIKGKCPHNCSYCYCKKWGEQSELHFDEKEFKTNLGENNFIFVGSSCDMFAHDIPSDWIVKTLEHCNKYPKNTYLFQTKNPKRFRDFKLYYPSNCILGVTIETNRESPSKAPSTKDRVAFMGGEELFGMRKMVTIEPVIDFDVPELVEMIKWIRPEFVNIGADSGNNDLQEPSSFKIQNLIKELEEFTKVNIKSNLNRLLEEDKNGTKTN